MRAYTPGGRFDSDFETNDILVGVDTDLKRPVGTDADWWIYSTAATVIDPIYDVASSTTGRMWTGPYSIPVVRAVINQGQAKTSATGFYNADTLHLTFNIEDVAKYAPNIIIRPDINNRDRVVWRGQVYRPFSIQERGIISNRFTILAVEANQLMPEEMVNDSQFGLYSSPGQGYGQGTYGYGSYGG
jgi:hypothetical protein